MDNLPEIVSQILKKENISYSSIRRASSGFTNDVFFIDKNYVIKLSSDKDKMWRLQKEIDLYDAFSFDFVPQKISSGKFEDYEYLILSQIKGKRLYSIWHKLDESTRKEIVGQIADILKQFHQIKAKLPRVDVITNWKKYWKIQIKIILKKLKKLDLYNDTMAKKLKESVKYLAGNDYCLIYNDAHFDNFIYDKGKLYLIDFDRVLHCPKDYELMIFKSMCDEPWKFANEDDEKNTKLGDYANLLAWLKEFCPEMFDNPFLKERLKLYQFHYYFEQAFAKNDKSWIEKLINNFIN